MTPDLRFEFTVDQSQNTITVVREFDGPRQLVWDCHTKRELLDRWFSPKPLITKTKHMDFRPGGYWHYAMITPDDQKYWSRLDYKTIDPIDGYTAQDGFCDEAGAVNPDMPRSTWQVSFVDADARTLVTTIVRYASAEAMQTVVDMGMKEGMTSTLERLDELLPQLQAK